MWKAATSRPVTQQSVGGWRKDEVSWMYLATDDVIKRWRAVLALYHYLSHCYTIAWDRLSNQFFLSVYVCMYVCMYVCICGHYGRIFQPIFAKFGKNLWGLNRKNWLGWCRNPKMPSSILAPKTKIFGAWIGISSQICKNFKSSYLQNYTSD